jgi:glycosyltransferase involved in cell wall biosynthesis
MECSIVIPTRNHSPLLDRTLESIRSQAPSFEYELIIVDDGSTDDTQHTCGRYGATYFRLENDHHRNPCFARNVGYRAARGRVIISQSDEVIHVTSNSIERLVQGLREGEFLIATVYDWDGPSNRRMYELAGPQSGMMWLYLGAVWRRDLYVVGGNDEEFTAPGYEDLWFLDCLIHGLRLKSRFLVDVVGHHQNHPHPKFEDVCGPSKQAYERKTALVQAGQIPYCSTGGPWLMNSDEGE